MKHKCSKCTEEFDCPENHEGMLTPDHDCLHHEINKLCKSQLKE